MDIKFTAPAKYYESWPAEWARLNVWTLWIHYPGQDSIQQEFPTEQEMMVALNKFWDEYSKTGVPVTVKSFNPERRIGWHW